LEFEPSHTFRVYPLGVTHRQQSERLRALSVLLWTLGLSLTGVVTILLALGCPLGRTIVHNNVGAAGQSARQKMRARLRGKVKVRVLGPDCSHLNVNGQDKVVIQSIDVEKGTTLEIELLPGEDEQTIVRYIERMAKLVGAEVLVTDDADAFKAAAEAAGLKQQICQRHVVPNTLHLLSEIGMELLARQQAGSPTGPEGLSIEQALQQRYQVASPPLPGKKASSFYRLRLLTLDLAEDWAKLTLSDTCRAGDGQRFIPVTNNASGQRIGLNIKERYRTMRGYKSKWSARQVSGPVHRAPRCGGALTAWLREADDPQALYALLAT